VVQLGAKEATNDAKVRHNGWRTAGLGEEIFRVESAVGDRRRQMWRTSNHGFGLRIAA
jgi:hypothetical protein